MWGRVDIYFSTSTFHCTQNVRLSLIGQVLCGMYRNIHGLQQDAEVIHFLFSFILSRIELEEAALYWWQQKDNENIYCILRFCLITLDILYVVFFFLFILSLKYHFEWKKKLTRMTEMNISQKPENAKLKSQVWLIYTGLQKQNDRLPENAQNNLQI